MEALFPVLAHYSASTVSPIFFYAASILLAAAILFIYKYLFTGLCFRLHVKEWLAVLGVTLFIVTSTLLIFIGTPMTTGINTAVLIQTEVFFAFLWGRLFFGETPVLMQIFGAMGVVVGTLMILFNGTLTVNPGDALILAAAATFPFGNACARYALRTLAPSTLLFLRYLLGSIILVPLAFLLADFGSASVQLIAHYPLVVAYALLILFVSKIFWYTGLRYMPVSIATGIVAVAPALSFALSFLVLQEIPNTFQIAGLVCAMGGVYLLVMHSELSLPVDDLV